MGYAVPGAVLAIGVMLAFQRDRSGVDSWTREWRSASPPGCCSMVRPVPPCCLPTAPGSTGGAFAQRRAGIPHSSSMDVMRPASWVQAARRAVASAYSDATQRSAERPYFWCSSMLKELPATLILRRSFQHLAVHL
ncbi:MAG: hypothetical protein H6974_06050 [Gammaproteobacteria bacterium]|nr:hypothetical protein [Gammaproteobacteria bacterium]